MVAGSWPPPGGFPSFQVWPWLSPYCPSTSWGTGCAITWIPSCARSAGRQFWICLPSILRRRRRQARQATAGPPSPTEINLGDDLAVNVRLQVTAGSVIAIGLLLALVATVGPPPSATEPGASLTVRLPHTVQTIVLVLFGLSAILLLALQRPRRPTEDELEPSRVHR